MDFGQAVKCLQRMRPRRMSPETPLTPGQAKLKDAASKMDFAEVRFRYSSLAPPPPQRQVCRGAGGYFAGAAASGRDGRRGRDRVQALQAAGAPALPLCGCLETLSTAVCAQMLEWLTAVGELKELEEEEHGEASTSADCFDALIEHDLDVDAALRQLSRRRR
eukprot:COSAG04_NODE_1148_length_8069_cov_3.844040_2_plen_163_part_00